MRRAVVLPAPLGPIRPKISPGFAVKETLSSARTEPRKTLVRFSTCTIESIGWPLSGIGCMTACGSERKRIGRLGRRPASRGRPFINVLIKHVSLPRNVAGFADRILDLVQ